MMNTLNSRTLRVSAPALMAVATLLLANPGVASAKKPGMEQLPQQDVGRVVGEVEALCSEALLMPDHAQVVPFDDGAVGYEARSGSVSCECLADEDSVSCHATDENGVGHTVKVDDGRGRGRVAEGRKRRTVSSTAKLRNMLSGLLSKFTKYE